MCRQILSKSELISCLSVFLLYPLNMQCERTSYISNRWLTISVYPLHHNGSAVLEIVCVMKSTTPPMNSHELTWTIQHVEPVNRIFTLGGNILNQCRFLFRCWLFVAHWYTASGSPCRFFSLWKEKRLFGLRQQPSTATPTFQQTQAATPSGLHVSIRSQRGPQQNRFTDLWKISHVWIWRGKISCASRAQSF